MRTGDLVRLTGVSRSTIDNYVARGIISAADDGGLRQFPDNTVKMVQIVNELASFGFRLEEIKRLFQEVTVEEIDSRLELLREFRKWVQSHQGA